MELVNDGVCAHVVVVVVVVVYSLIVCNLSGYGDENR
jgi:hypothetical protein